MATHPLLIGILTCCSAWFIPTLAVAQTRSPDAIEVTFTPSTTEAELLLIKDRVKAKGLDLTYTDLRYDQGLLRSLAFKLVTDQGEGTAKGEIRAEERFGFYYDPTPQGGVKLIVGPLPTW
ncbi:MAG: hypothetical protein IT230_06385 [Flavobacteriales bacterium]|jgi:hypothetical protein|nr:hypothetical protein [Flavobacteriales bacterium]